jgi:hypothetical protein
LDISQQTREELLISLSQLFLFIVAESDFCIIGGS